MSNSGHRLIDLSEVQLIKKLIDVYLKRGV